ncbi:uncharacterized protein LOC111119441 [Crassostrea virginica]
MRSRLIFSLPLLESCPDVTALSPNREQTEQESVEQESPIDTHGSSCERDDVTGTGAEACSQVMPMHKKARRKISMEHLQKMQYEVLCCQKKNLELQNKKLVRDIERDDLEKENLRLKNAKLVLEIDCFKQIVSQNENAFLTLQAISDEYYIFFQCVNANHTNYFL